MTAPEWLTEPYADDDRCGTCGRGIHALRDQCPAGCGDMWVHNDGEKAWGCPAPRAACGQGHLTRAEVPA